MKIFKYLILIIFLVSCFEYTNAQRAIKNGFSISAMFGIVSEEYGIYEINESFPLKKLIGLEFGNRWYFNPSEQTGFGLMINWLDISVASKSYTGDEIDVAAIDMALFEIGPIGTYALSNDMAIDAYYNLRPTVFAHAVVDEDEDSYAAGGAGITHAIGTAFRYGTLNIGLEYVVGNISISEEESDGINLYPGEKMKNNGFRFLIGFKF